MPRFHVDLPLAAGRLLELPEGAARHVQVLRLQPGADLTLFDGRGGEWSARVTRMGRREVEVELQAHDPVERELPVGVTLVAAMPANDRFDWLVEKATELGATAILPVQCQRSVLRLSGERAERRRDHWQAVAVAAAEQCGRTRVPDIALPRPLESLAADPLRLPAGTQRLLLSPTEACTLAERRRACPDAAHWTVFSGPEGGFTPEEDARLRALGACAVTLGPRVLRAETAPLLALALLGGGH
ncbi:MAG: 16S rRNA (uracil(1498)-N(3))-methyltransferase [Burkholderiaceae bacterium]|nr:16S rRNA (uracil(1498)-N(3))-methyltransferase [Burkholderiaceae bacterium]